MRPNERRNSCPGQGWSRVKFSQSLIIHNVSVAIRGVIWRTFFGNLMLQPDIESPYKHRYTGFETFVKLNLLVISGIKFSLT